MKTTNLNMMKNINQSVSLNLGKFGFRASGNDAAELLSTTLKKAAGPILITAVLGSALYFSAKYGIKRLFAYKPSRSVQQSPTDSSENLSENEVVEQPVPSCRNVSDLVDSEEISQTTPLINGIIDMEDIHILAGDSNIGKSFYALAYAFKAASGKPSPIVPDDCPCEPCKVFYYDGELVDGEFRRRCLGVDKATLANIERISNCSFNSTDEFMDDVERRVLKCDKDVVVDSDNMFSLLENLSPKQANTLLKRIQALRKKTNRKITFIFVAHTNKEYDMYSPLLKQHIDGSYRFVNMAASISAVTVTKHDENTKMLKLLKFRNSYKDKNIVYVEEMVDESYPHPIFKRYDKEENVLPIKPNRNKDRSEDKQEKTVSSDIIQQIKEFYKPGVYGHGLKQVAKEFGEEIGCDNAEEVRRFFAKHIPELL